MKIRDKVVFVTGGASGLGEAAVRRILESGGRAVILDMSKENGEKLAAELGDRTLFMKADISDENEIKNAIEKTVNYFSKIDILVNCAGIGDACKVLGKNGPQSLASFSRVMNINLIGTFNVIRLAAEKMAKNSPDENGERGVIINTSSIASFEGQIGQASYSASKAAINGMTLPLAREFAGYGIRVMTIAPGLFNTPLLMTLPENIRNSLGEMVPFPRRLGRPEEFALMVESIIINPMLNGDVIRLDGALRMAGK
jgi:3-hydroxyacyl-CoA dehydrogenase / 3-hydroxy-2-methylbutyryl-CoA dehydrogenase